MELRACARANLALPVEFGPSRRPASRRGHTRNIGIGGLFIAAAPDMHCGEELEITLHLPRQARVVSLRCQVARTARNGFAARFAGLDGSQRRLLQALVNPEWDGKDVFEGLLLATAWQPASDLPGMLRLASVVGNQYRRLCNGHTRQ